MLLPMVAGLIMWNILPEKMPTHWDSNGEINGYSSKPFAVFGIPAIMVFLHLICVLATSLDNKTKNFNTKMMGIVIWTCPAVSVLCTAAIYAAALGYDVRVEFIIPLFIGILFLVIGNFLPKCKQNHTIGIKTPWTLGSEENWNKTHRFAGFIWTVCSIIIIIGAFFKNAVVYTTFIPIAVMAIVPITYSYIYYRKYK